MTRSKIRSKAEAHDGVESVTNFWSPVSQPACLSLALDLSHHGDLT